MGHIKDFLLYYEGVLVPFTAFSLLFISIVGYKDCRDVNNAKVMQKVLKIADINKSGILEQSELSKLIKEIEPDYVLPEVNNYLLEVGKIGENKINIESNKQHPTPTIYIPKSKLETYLENHNLKR